MLRNTPHLIRSLALSASVAILGSSSLGAQELDFDVETYRLANGATVILHPDRSLPKVVIDTWFRVGSKDEAKGRTGFAHLFEHLMFMGTGRVPDSQFDVIMESGGGSNNASTSRDRTNYYSQGPSSLLPTLLWLDADRLDALADHMTQAKLDGQRAVVRNERRQTSENVPYGVAGLTIPGVLYPEDHPYHHTVIGSHEDLEAATVQDVVDFFHRFYVPGNATLVVAGDFDPAVVKPLIESTFGAVEAAPVPEHKTADPVVLSGEKTVVLEDSVQFPRLYLAWPSPAFFKEGDAEMDLAAAVLSSGPSSRLMQRLVFGEGLAQDVVAYQSSGELGSEFMIVATAASPDGDLDAIKDVILEELEKLQSEGPSDEELERVQTQMEAGFLRGLEGILDRAEALHRYHHYFGEANSFSRDLDRWRNSTPERISRMLKRFLGEGRVDCRVLPVSDAPAGDSMLDQRPADLESTTFRPPVPEEFMLPNGIRVLVNDRKGTGLFAGKLIVQGGESLVPSEQAGLADLYASLVQSGAGGLDAAQFASKISSLGGSLEASASTTTFEVSVEGIASQADPIMDLFADMILRPNLTEEDFEREQDLQLASIGARSDDPNSLARLLGSLRTFGTDDPRGRPGQGYAYTVDALSIEDMRKAQSLLVQPDRATFVFAGDFSVEELEDELGQRFGDWKPSVEVELGSLEPLAAVPEPGIVLFDRPDAPQSILWISRPIPQASGADVQAARKIADSALGGSFTSRLNSNLREDKGYSYGAFSRVLESGGQPRLVASSAVRTDVTGVALAEFRKEFASLHKDGLQVEELGKAVKTLRSGMVSQAETTSSIASAIAARVRDGKAVDGAGSELAALERASLQAVNRVAASGLWSWSDLLVVIVGDAKAVLPQLEEAGFPEPTMVDEEGRPIER